ncbi:MAG: hypothetical protein AAGE59_16595 [Cyanobacteria bacterium P01_F01_bin.86]
MKRRYDIDAPFQVIFQIAHPIPLSHPSTVQSINRSVGQTECDPRTLPLHPTRSRLVEFAHGHAFIRAARSRPGKPSVSLPIHIYGGEQYTLRLGRSRDGIPWVS